MSEWKRRRIGRFSTGWLVNRGSNGRVTLQLDIRWRRWRYLRFRYESYPMTGYRARSLRVSWGRAS